MDCPECKTGKIRVIAQVVCSCGHHKLACDGCFKVFGVECGPPFDETKLPPEFPVHLDDSFSQAQEKVGAMLSEKKRKFAEASWQQMIRKNPLLEDFKKTVGLQT
jgi:transposase-like protein